jgi:hypothetical protein
MGRLSWSGWAGISAIAGVVAAVVALLMLILPSPSATTAGPSPSTTVEPPRLPSTSVAVTSSRSVASENSPLTSTYVDDYAKACSIALTTGPASINGSQYAHSVLQWAGDTDNAITVSRKATRFQATIGLRDDASDRVQAQFELDGDNGKQLFRSNILSLGETQPVDIPLEGVLRITLRIKAVSSTWGYGGWGDARLILSGAPAC